MKSIFTWILLAAFYTGVNAQELDSLKAIMNNRQSPEKQENQGSPDNKSYSPVIINDSGDQVKIKLGDKELLKVVDKGDSTYVKLGQNKALEVIDQPDSTRIRVAGKLISIVEKNDNTQVHIGKADKDEDHPSKKFRGHWAGFEWGLNNFLDNNFTLSREGDAEFMDLNTGRSWSIDLNFAQYSLGFGSSHVGLVTGLGLQYNNYFFDGSNSLVEVNDVTVSLPLNSSILSKSKLTTSYLRIPLIMEVQFPGSARANRFYISAGIVGGLKLGSHAKYVYKDDSGKKKQKDNDDFNINPFRYGVTARVGFGSLAAFCDYYFTPMFIVDKGPELHPLNLGLSFSF